MRKISKKYKRPQRPWDSRRIEEERGIMKAYGLRSKKELWRTQEILRQFRRRARELISQHDPSKTRVLIDKLASLGILNKEAGLDNVLSLSVTNILDRRLQTVVHRRKLATTPLQARQMIIHGHIFIAGRRARFPSLLVPSDREGTISLKGGKNG